MKVLVIHHHGSYHKFEGVYSNYLFEIKDGAFYVYSRDFHSGEEFLHACFRDWDYFVIEEEI